MFQKEGEPRYFGGKLKNFQSKEEREINTKMLKAYNKGKKTFLYKGRVIPVFVSVVPMNDEEGEVINRPNLKINE